jgi:hypothetical protein
MTQHWLTNLSPRILAACQKKKKKGSNYTGEKLQGRNIILQLIDRCNGCNQPLYSTLSIWIQGLAQMPVEEMRMVTLLLLHKALGGTCGDFRLPVGTGCKISCLFMCMCHAFLYSMYSIALTRTHRPWWIAAPVTPFTPGNCLLISH